jgi:hypothetical protein
LRDPLLVLILTLAACTPPIRQFDLKNQQLTCEQANEYAFRALQSMGFATTHFEPASVGRRGTLRGTRQELGVQDVTVMIRCGGHGADIDASEDGKWLGQVEFKRGFYLAFTAVAAQAAISDSVAREQAQRPLEEKKGKGLHVLLAPVRGLASKLDFDLDIAAGGVLPVRVTISNITLRTYSFDPNDFVLADKNGERVHPLSAADAARRIARALSQKAQDQIAAAPDPLEVTRRLQAKMFVGHSVSANQTLTGYLYFPLADYVKGRVTLEDQASEEAEGFVVEF